MCGPLRRRSLSRPVSLGFGSDLGFDALTNLPLPSRFGIAIVLFLLALFSYARSLQKRRPADERVLIVPGRPPTQTVMSGGVWIIPSSRVPPGSRHYQMNSQDHQIPSQLHAGL